MNDETICPVLVLGFGCTVFGFGVGHDPHHSGLDGFCRFAQNPVMSNDLLQKIYSAFSPAPLEPGQQNLYVDLDPVRGGQGIVQRGF